MPGVPQLQFQSTIRPGYIMDNDLIIFQSKFRISVEGLPENYSVKSNKKKNWVQIGYRYKQKAPENQCLQGLYCLVRCPGLDSNQHILANAAT